jgi:hypothetical protein
VRISYKVLAATIAWGVACWAWLPHNASLPVALVLGGCAVGVIVGIFDVMRGKA